MIYSMGGRVSAVRTRWPSLPDGFAGGLQLAGHDFAESLDQQTRIPASILCS